MHSDFKEGADKYLVGIGPGGCKRVLQDLLCKYGASA